MAKCYVIISGRGHTPDTEMSIFVSNSAKEAHDGAADQYRKTRDLQPSVHIDTATAYTCDTEEEARAFFKKVHEGLEEAE